MKNKILLAEDDKNLGIVLKEYLELKGFAVDLCMDGEEAVRSFTEGRPDICVLDVMMPKKDGFTAAKEIRKLDEWIPLIFLTARSMQKDKIEGFKAGADDYITKPFSTEELLMRINAVIRRSAAQAGIPSEKEIYKIGKFSFEPAKRTLTGKQTRKLTAKENELLSLLLLKENDILGRAEALTRIWGEENYFTSRSMDVYIAKLRGYLKEDKTISILTYHGEGFKLITG